MRAEIMQRSIIESILRRRKGFRLLHMRSAVSVKLLRRGMEGRRGVSPTVRRLASEELMLAEWRCVVGSWLAAASVP
jgi:hypothetical protein